MGPTLILDKSALQALSQTEMTALHRYYLLNIVPVLLIEILGDLQKPSPDGVSKTKVVELSKKTFPFSSAVNVHYQQMLVGSLMGYPVGMDGRPALGGGCAVQAADGQKGIVFEETPEEKALLRWRSSDFLAAEEALAERWRTTTRGFDLEKFKEHLKMVWHKHPGIQDLQTLLATIKSLTSSPERQTELLTMLVLEFGLDQASAQNIFLRWETEGPHNVASFAPYAHYCFNVSLFFKVGLVHDLIGTRRTNRVDMEYLYYLPFCNVFCSGDKLHAGIVPLFLRNNQRFISRNELKPDLAMLSNDLATAGPAGVERTPEESVTASLWSQFMTGPMSQHGWVPPEAIGQQRDHKLADFIESRYKGAIDISEGESPFGSDEADFIIKKTTILGSDPCPCGSRKAFSDCHGKNIVHRGKDA